MKKLTVFLLTIGILLSFCSCQKDSTPSNKSEENSATQNEVDSLDAIQTYGDLTQRLSKDTTFHSWSAHWIEDGDSPITVYYELYTTKETTYYSYHSESDNSKYNQQFLVRHNPQNIAETGEFYYNGSWVPAVDGVYCYPAQSHTPEDFGIPANTATATDGTIEVNGTAHNSKRVTLSEKYVLDYYIENGANMVVITDNKTERISFNNIICADQPTENSSIAKSMNAPQQDGVVGYIATTDSMLPLMGTGDISYFSKVTNPNELQVGDVVLGYASMEEEPFYTVQKIRKIEPSNTYIVYGTTTGADSAFSFTFEDIIGKLIS